MNTVSKKSKFFPLVLYANVLNFHVYKTLRSGYTCCHTHWGSATPSPDPAIPPLMHSFIFLYSPSSPPSLSIWQNIISITPKSVQILAISPVAFSKYRISRRWDLGICFFKIFTGDSHDKSGLLIPTPDYYWKPDAFKRDRGRRSLHACNIIVCWRKIN